MKLIVFGASGGCGAHLVRQAAARGHQVTAIVRPSTAYAPPDGGSPFPADLLDAAFVSTAVSGHEAVASCLGIRYRYLCGKRQSPDDFISTATENIVSAM